MSDDNDNTQDDKKLTQLPEGELAKVSGGGLRSWWANRQADKKSKQFNDKRKNDQKNEAWPLKQSSGGNGGGHHHK